MKKLIGISALLLSALSMGAFAQASNTAQTDVKNDEIAINFKMIEKYRNADFSENQLTFVQLVNNYSFSEIKLIANAYKTGGLNSTSRDEINTYLAKFNDADESSPLELYSEKHMMATKE